MYFPGSWLVFSVYFPGECWCIFSRLLLVFGSYRCILVYIFLVYIDVNFPGSFWCLVCGIVASNCAPIKSWMNDGGEVSFDRIVSEMAFLFFTYFENKFFGIK